MRPVDPHGNDREAIVDLAHRMAAAIRRRDGDAIRELLDSEFVQRTIGGGAVNAEAFVAAVGQIPGEMLSVEITSLDVDIDGDAAIVAGMQHARVRLDGQVIDDTRPFVDWMVKRSGVWLFRAAIDLPS